MRWMRSLTSWRKRSISLSRPVRGFQRLVIVGSFLACGRRGECAKRPPRYGARSRPGLRGVEPRALATARHRECALPLYKRRAKAGEVTWRDLTWQEGQGRQSVATVAFHRSGGGSTTGRLTISAER